MKSLHATCVISLNLLTGVRAVWQDLWLHRESSPGARLSACSLCSPQHSLTTSHDERSSTLLLGAVVVWLKVSLLDISRQISKPPVFTTWLWPKIHSAHNCCLQLKSYCNVVCVCQSHLLKLYASAGENVLWDSDWGYCFIGFTGM